MSAFIPPRAIRLFRALSVVVFGILFAGNLAGAAPSRTLSSLTIGEWVEAEISQGDSGAWVTRELDIKKQVSSGGGSLTAPLVRGAAGRIILLGLTIDVTAAAFKDSAGDNASLDTVPDGAMVEAHVRTESGGLKATKLRARTADTMPEIEGPLQAVQTAMQPRIRILGLDIAVSDDVEIRTQRKRRQFIRTIDDDELDASSHVRIGPFFMGAVADLGVDPEKNYDLNSGREHDIVNSDVSGRLELLGKITQSVHLFAKGGYRRRIIIRDQRNREQGFGRFEFAQGYILFNRVARPDLALQVGRQDFDEKHEWLYDENLDAVRLHYLGEKLWGEASISTRFGKESMLTNRWNAIFSMALAVNTDLELGAYLIRRMPRSSHLAPTLTWTGLRVLSADAGAFEGWGELSSVTGSENGVSIRGQAVHLSGSVVLEPKSRLMVNGSWARGSGDDDPGDGVDHSFRQTGFHDNNDRFGGVTSFRYYGELADPELSNLTITSVGAGIRPTRSISVDVLLHKYRQVEAFPDLRGSPLDASPNGLSTEIGEEADIVLGFRRLPTFKLELVLAMFRAGDAFPDSGEKATLSRIQFQVGF